MINKEELIRNSGIIISYILGFLLALVPTALAEAYETDICTRWNTIDEFDEVSSLRKFLVSKDWINEDVSIEELDYILVLTKQCSEESFPTVPMPLVLAVISVESGFNRDLVGFSNDTGLMQIIPKYHKERIKKYICDDNADLFDPRVNVMVGMDYLEELLDWSDGDISTAVMGYNMGQANAKKYSNSGRTTYYCDIVTERMDAIQTFLERR